jgi:hypothetical protein
MVGLSPYGGGPLEGTRVPVNTPNPSHYSSGYFADGIFGVSTANNHSPAPTDVDMWLSVQQHSQNSPYIVSDSSYYDPATYAYDLGTLGRQ